MFSSIRRLRTSLAGVWFCDSCTEVSTHAQRAERHLERARTTAYTLIGR